MMLQEPAVVERILDSIQSISDEARRALGDPELPRDKLLFALEALITENHAHLVALGVSHPVLETIRAQTAAEPYGLTTKLTGAGGGGCSVTLIPDGGVHRLFVFRLPADSCGRCRGQRLGRPC